MATEKPVTLYYHLRCQWFPRRNFRKKWKNQKVCKLLPLTLVYSHLITTCKFPKKSSKYVFTESTDPNQLRNLREELISQGVNLPNLTSDYNLNDQFETFSRHDGHCGSALTTAKTTATNDTQSTHNAAGHGFQPSTIYTSIAQPIKGTVGCNDDHEGLNYQILLDNEEKADYIPFDADPSFQEGK